MMSKKTYPFVIILVLGAILAALSFVFSGEEQKVLSGILIGVGAGLFGMSTANIIMKRYEKKNPSVVRQSKIEYKDERNTIIRNKARAMAGNIIHWFFVVLAFVMIIIDAPLWLTLSTVVMFLLYDVLTFVLMSRYQKEM
jgi:hypothetical protein